MPLLVKTGFYFSENHKKVYFGISENWLSVRHEDVNEHRTFYNFFTLHVREDSNYIGTEIFYERMKSSWAQSVRI